MENEKETLGPLKGVIWGPLGGVWPLVSEESEGMDPYSSPYITHYGSFHFLFHSFIPS